MLPNSDNGSRFFFLFPLYCLIDVRDAGGTQMVILRRNIPTCLPLYNQANIGQRDCPCLQIVWQPSRRRTVVGVLGSYISRKKLFQKDIIQRIVTIFATETPRNINRMAKIKVQNTEITIINHDDKDYISLTDMVRNIENGLALIEKWLRNKNTIEFLGIWEEMYNPDFNSPEFEGIKNEAGLNRFILSVKQ